MTLLKKCELHFYSMLKISNNRTRSHLNGTFLLPVLFTLTVQRDLSFCQPHPPPQET